jgi:hypothetical protein
MTTLPEKYFNTLLLEMASLFEGDDCVAGVETADALRTGLFMQRPNSYYPLHNHDAVETYVMIKGVGYWTQGKETTHHEIGGIVKDAPRI